MFLIERLRRPSMLFAAIAAFVAVLVGGAQAASAAPGQVVHQDVTGAVFTLQRRVDLYGPLRRGAFPPSRKR
jgi:hypothetical protein